MKVMLMRAKWIVFAFGFITMIAFAFDQFGAHPDRAIAVDMVDANGEDAGVIVIQPVARGRVLVTVNALGLTPGLHGFHIHETGLCEVNGDEVFLSANSHFDLHGNDHGQHSGDLPLLDADQTGRAFLAVHTDRFKFGDLMDADGSAFIIHAGADNFANVPDRYGGADSTTLSNGDAGARVACGVIAAPK